MRSVALFWLTLTILSANLLAHPTQARGAETESVRPLISAVLTGATSASDEYVRIEASGSAGVDLSDVELIYKSASGITTRRLVSLASVGSLVAGGSLTVANAAGSFASTSQLTWVDGIASSGGVLLLRRVSAPTQIIDAVAWGNAALTAGGEGVPAPIPASGFPLLRRHDSFGMLIDTGSNSSDFAAETPTASATPAPTPSTTPVASASPSASPSPVAVPLTISEARAALIGTRLVVRGLLTAVPGELAEPSLAALQDAATGAGLFLLLPVGLAGLVRGQVVEVSGVLTLRRQTLTLVASIAPERVGDGVALSPVTVQRPAAGAWAWEEWEGRRIRVSGMIAGSPGTLANGAISLRLRLNTGEELLLAASASAAATLSVALQASGRSVVAQGLIHQWGTSNGGGYRLWLDPLAGLVPATAPSGPPGGEVGGTPGGGMTPLVPRTLPPGTPTIAVPVEADPSWLREIVTVLRVREGRLELWRGWAIALVVLPTFGKPVDHEGAVPYPEPR